MNHQDLQFIRANESTSRGYYNNVGRTQRQGFDLGLSGQHDRFRWNSSYSYIDATFDSNFSLVNSSNSSAPNEGGEAGGQNTFNVQIEEVLPIPPESLRAYSFLTSKGEDFLLDYDYLKDKNVYFYMNDCIENDIELFIVKEKFKCDLVEMHNNKQYYEF
jgi:outer membrane receptor protein involved in Fe transport